MSVPDPHFHNFDSDGMENSFQDYHMWFAYYDDVMPRLYALIQMKMNQNQRIPATQCYRKPS